MHPSSPMEPDRPTCREWVVTLLQRGSALRDELRAAGALEDLRESAWKPTPSPGLDAGSAARLATLVQTAHGRRQSS